MSAARKTLGLLSAHAEMEGPAVASSPTPRLTIFSFFCSHNRPITQHYWQSLEGFSALIHRQETRLENGRTRARESPEHVRFSDGH